MAGPPCIPSGGELAWQLGKEDAYARIKNADTSGTSPGKDVLTQLLAVYAPCVILMDELVAYVRQFEDWKTFSGGTYDANLSFLQALTEALKAVPTAVLLASLPESDKEARASVVSTLCAPWSTTSPGCRRYGNPWRPRRPSRSSGAVSLPQ